MGEFVERLKEDVNLELVMNNFTDVTSDQAGILISQSVYVIFGVVICLFVFAGCILCWFQIAQKNQAAFLSVSNPIPQTKSKSPPMVANTPVFLIVSPFRFSLENMLFMRIV